MNTLGEKVPSCQRSEGSPLSEYEAPLKPPVPLCFPGPAFFELSWRQLDTQTFFAHDLDLLCFSRTSLARPSLGLLGGPLCLPLLLSSILACLPVSPSYSFYVQRCPSSLLP